MKLRIILFLLLLSPVCTFAQNEVVGEHSTINALDEKPSYPGGIQAMMAFISANEKDDHSPQATGLAFIIFCIVLGH